MLPEGPVVVQHLQVPQSLLLVPQSLLQVPQPLLPSEVLQGRLPHVTNYVTIAGLLQGRLTFQVSVNESSKWLNGHLF